MFKNLSKRQRSVMLISIAGILLFAVLAVIFWPSRSSQKYIQQGSPQKKQKTPQGQLPLALFDFFLNFNV